MTELVPTEIPGLFSIRPFHSSDRRGSFVKTFHEADFKRLGLPTNFRETYFSSSAAGVVRGMHLQQPPMDHGKLIYCSAGQVIDVVVDLRQGSPTFGGYLAFELDGASPSGLFIPRGCAHGFLSLTDGATLLYAVETIYDAATDTGIRWDSFGYRWPVSQPIMSSRDQELPLLDDFVTPFQF